MSTYLCNDQLIHNVASATSIAHEAFADAFIDAAKRIGYPCSTLAQALKLANLLAVKQRYGDEFSDADLAVHAKDTGEVSSSLFNDIKDEIKCLAYQCAEFSERDQSKASVFVRGVIQALNLVVSGYEKGIMQKVADIANAAIAKAKGAPVTKAAPANAAPEYYVAPGLRMMRYYVEAGGQKVRVAYYATKGQDGRVYVSIRQKDYGHELAQMLGGVCRNDSNTMEDYFCHTTATIGQDHPMFAQALRRAEESKAAAEAGLRAARRK